MLNFVNWKLTSRKENPLIYFFESVTKYKTCLGAISEIQLLMTITVVVALKHYYRSKSADKWGKLFSQSESCIIHLTRLQKVQFFNDVRYEMKRMETQVLNFFLGLGKSMRLFQSKVELDLFQNMKKSFILMQKFM
jgi:hypothetical protein